MPSQIGRRGFLGAALAVAGTALGSSVLWWQYTNARGRHVLRLGAWVSASQDAQDLGRAYFAIQPEEAGVETLTRLLSTDLDLSPFGMNDGDLRQVSRARARRDFEDGNTITVQGWVFSRTELRLCGLAALLAAS